MKRVLSFAFVFLACIAAANAQKLDPIQWTLTSDVAKAPAGSSVPLHLKATFQEGWHLYSLTTPKGGPIPTTAELAEKILQLPVRIGSPKRVGGLTDVVANPSYSTAVGLVLMGMQSAHASGAKKGMGFGSGEDMFKNVLGRMKKWFGDSI